MKSALQFRIPTILTLLNRFDLPEVVIALIKDFGFYSFEKWILLFHKQKNAKLVDIFLNSRLDFTHPNIPNNGSLVGSWSLIPFNDPNYHHFTAKNCIKCGNYKESDIYCRFLPNKIKCICFGQSILVSDNHKNNEQLKADKRKKRRLMKPLMFINETYINFIPTNLNNEFLNQN